MMGFGGGGTGLVVGGLVDLGPIQVTGGQPVTTPGDGYKYHIFNNKPQLLLSLVDKEIFKSCAKAAVAAVEVVMVTEETTPVVVAVVVEERSAGTITFAGAKNVPVVVGARGNSGGNSNSGNSYITFTFPGIATSGGGGGGSNGPGAGCRCNTTGSSSAPNH